MQLLQKLKTWSEYHNPYHYWWLGRKYFKRPKAHLVKGEFSGYFGMPCQTDSYKGLQFHFVGLGWKSKYDSPRHEWDPVICVTWTTPWKVKEPNKFSEKGYIKRKKTYWFGFVFNWVNEGVDWKDDSHTASMATWESLLDYTVWGHDIKWCCKHHIWKSSCEKDANNITINDNLNENI